MGMGSSDQVQRRFDGNFVVNVVIVSLVTARSLFTNNYKRTFHLAICLSVLVTAQDDSSHSCNVPNSEIVFAMNGINQIN